MCYCCLDIIKEKLTPEEFWRNYRELVNIDENHATKMIEEMNKTSKEYQEEVSRYGLTESSVLMLRES